MKTRMIPLATGHTRKHGPKSAFESQQHEDALVGTLVADSPRETMSENFTCMLVLHFIELSSRGKQNVVNYVKQWHPTTVARRADSAV